MHGNISNQERAVSQARALPPAEKSSANETAAHTPVVATFKQRDRWSRKIARDPRVKLMHCHVLRSLALCAHTDKDGRLVIDPTYAELAKAARCHRDTAIRAVNVAEEIGIVRKARHSDGRVSNDFELLLPQAGSNGRKFPPAEVATDANVNFPTVANLPVAAGSNGSTATTVLSVESKEEINTVYVETVCVDHFTSDDAAIPEPQILRQRAPDGALIKTVAEQKQQPPCSASKNIGAAALANGAHAGPGFDAVCQSAREVFGAKGDAVAVRLLAALGDDVEDALDHLAVAAEEADPMNYLKLEVERLRAARQQGARA